jgi:hypothetical protein
MYQQRTYRNLVKNDELVSFEVIVQETDLLVRATKDLSRETTESVLKFRRQLETYISSHPEFEKSLVPLPDDPYAPAIVQEMIRAGQVASVGPMAAVAGVIAEFVSKDLLPLSDEIVVENGGDIYLSTTQTRTIGIYAGESSLSLEIALIIDPEDSPLGICTSSGTVGHSLSIGQADAVCVVSKSAALADAAATSVGNIVHCKSDIERGLERAREIEGVTGTLIIVGDRMGVWGNVKLTRC